jgi:hypothetical protein
MADSNYRARYGADMKRYGDPEEVLNKALTNLNDQYTRLKDPNYGRLERDRARENMMAANQSMYQQAKRDASKMGTSMGSVAGNRVSSANAQRVAQGVSELEAMQEKQKSEDLFRTLAQSESMAKTGFSMGDADRSFYEGARRYDTDYERQRELLTVKHEFDMELQKANGDIALAVAQMEKKGWRSADIFNTVFTTGAAIAGKYYFG